MEEVAFLEPNSEKIGLAHVLAMIDGSTLVETTRENKKEQKLYLVVADTITAVAYGQVPMPFLEKLMLGGRSWTNPSVPSARAAYITAMTPEAPEEPIDAGEKGKGKKGKKAPVVELLPLEDPPIDKAFAD